jgi:tRNA threonylcarbamoyladenosine biosynthesis protein TsaB
MAGDASVKVLAIRTDKLEAELYVYDDNKQQAELKWPAHLKLAETLNSQIEKILNKSSISYKDISGIVVYKGPGSFTGLRIGISIANALAYAHDLPIAATTGEAWLPNGLKALQEGLVDKIAVPEYGTPPRTTEPRK